MAKHNGHPPAATPMKAPPLSAQEPSKADPQDWHELGDFFVSFGYVLSGTERHYQTRAYLSQDGLFMAWEGIAMRELMEWIYKQARNLLPATVSPPTAESGGTDSKPLPGAPVQVGAPPIAMPQTPPALPREVSFAQTQSSGPALEPSVEPSLMPLYRVHQQPAPVSDENAFQETTADLVDLAIAQVPMAARASTAGVVSDAPALLRASARVRMFRPEFQKNAGESFRVEFFLVDLSSEHAEGESGTEARLGSQSGEFETYEFSRAVELDFPVPAVGVYQLRAVAKLTLPQAETSTVMAQAMGPRLRVE